MKLRLRQNRFVYGFTKRFFDLLLSIFMIIFFSWLLIIIAILVKATTRGPILYIKKRGGKDGRAFKFIKFRTMTVGDHSIKNGRYVEVRKNDKKITRIGAFLRMTSLDELPQVFNILVGNMSFVGPRPHPVELDNEISKKLPHYFERYRIKPGLTGWAQVNGSVGPANNVKEMGRRLDLDLWYVENRSIWLDFKILTMTVGSIIRRK